jgi:hypothetical protein
LRELFKERTMADNLPEPTPAPNGTPAPTPPAPSVPEPKPADVTPSGPPAPSAPAITLTDDQKTYLKGQGLTDADLASPDALTKIINHAQSSQKTVSEYKTKIDAIKGTVTPPEPNPFGTPTPQPDGSQPQPNGTPEPAKGLDPVTALTLSTSLVSSFPELKDDLTSGKFYQDMQALGIPVQVNGQVNLQGILGYGKIAQGQAQVAAKMEELNKPGEGAIPDATPTTPTQPAADAPMTKQMAYAIALQDRNHPRFAEAQKYLQDNVAGAIK